MRNLIIISLLILAYACTPKVSEQAQTTEQPKEIVKTEAQLAKLSPCKKFMDAASPDEAETAHVLYRDFLKNKKYAEAFKYWQKAYELAPAADGQRDYHFLDGVKLYEQKIQNTTDESQRIVLINTLLGLYDEATACYPKRTSMYKGLKAFKLYYSFRDQADDLEIYTLFKEVLDEEGEKAPDFVINPFTALMIDLFGKEKIKLAEAQKYTSIIKESIANGVANCKTPKACERWDIVKSYAPVRLEEFEGIEGFYDCDYYKAQYYAAFENNPTDCDSINTTYSRLKWGKCPDVDAQLSTIAAAKQQHCRPPVETISTLRQGVNALNDGDYKTAIQFFETFVAETDNIEKKAKYTLIIAKIYYANFKRYATARTYAEKAIALRPNWGDPHLLIGKLYASSGPLCGPGRGFDSQIVTWVAIDEWNKAKRKDSSTTTEANKLINRYNQYMPSKEDVFIRNLKVGNAYKVPCWIQRTTTIRTAD